MLEKIHTLKAISNLKISLPLLGIDDTDVVALGTTIRDLRLSLFVLQLKRNKITKHGAASLVKLICEKSSTLQKLRLNISGYFSSFNWPSLTYSGNRNSLGNDGCDAMARAMGSSPNLESIMVNVSDCRISKPNNLFKVFGNAKEIGLNLGFNHIEQSSLGEFFEGLGQRTNYTRIKMDFSGIKAKMEVIRKLFDTLIKCTELQSLTLIFKK